jgi:hypothetical protein
VKPSTTRSLIAALVTIGGVVAILAVNAARQREQTEVAGREWIGEQWDVARNCLTGTPIGRGESEATITRRLEQRLLETLARSPRDPSRAWPARCAGIFPTLHADRVVMRADPGDSLAQLEVLVPRVLGAPPYDVREIAPRARELAGAIAVLDRAMPAGAEYDRSDFEGLDVGMPAAAILASLECAELPRLAPSTTCEAGGVSHTIGDAGWVSAQRGTARPPVALARRPGARAIMGCDERGMAVLWREDGAWQGELCTNRRCAALPALRAPWNMAGVALDGEVVIAVAAGGRSNVPSVHVFDGEWRDPAPVGRGTPSSSPTSGARFRLDTCRGAFTSADGIRWQRAPR